MRAARRVGRWAMAAGASSSSCVLLLVDRGAAGPGRDHDAARLAADDRHHRGPRASAAPVTVIRDATGIIQITADDQHDLFMAQGYVHAQERMWQMEISRRIGAGRLSELFGKSQVDTDTYIRTLGWRVAAQRDLDAMSRGVEGDPAGLRGRRERLDRRARGPPVDAVRRRRASSPGPDGIGGYTLEPWTPLDTATWQKVQAWSLGGNVDSEIFRLLADARLGDPAKTDELFPAYDATAPVITPTRAGRIGAARRARRAADGAARAAAPARTAAARSPGVLATCRPLTDGARRRRSATSRDSAASRRRARGLRPRRRGSSASHGVGLEQLGRLGRAHRERQADPRERPAPRLRHALGLDHERAALPERRRRLPVGRRRRHVPRRAGGDPRAQRAGSPGAPPTSNPDTQDLFLETVDPSDPRVTTSTRARSRAVRGPPRGRSRSPAAPTSSSTFDRPATASSSATSTPA